MSIIKFSAYKNERKTDRTLSVFWECDKEQLALIRWNGPYLIKKNIQFDKYTGLYVYFYIHFKSDATSFFLNALPK